MATAFAVSEEPAGRYCDVGNPTNRPNCRRSDIITGSSFLASFVPAIENMTTKNDIKMVIISAYDTIHSGAPSLGCSSAGGDADMVKPPPARRAATSAADTYSTSVALCADYRPTEFP